MAELPENDRLAGPFVAAGGQTDFPADFPLIDAPGDPAGTCVIFVRGRNGAHEELTLGDFSVVDATSAGFTVRLVVGALAGDRCFVVGRQLQKRLRAHTLNGAVRTATLEDDAREAAARGQEAQRDLSRTVAAPLGEPGQQLPAAADRQGRLYVGGGAGEPLALLAGAEEVVILNAAGQAATLPLTTLYAELGTDILDDGEWLAAADPSSNDDGVWG